MGTLSLLLMTEMEREPFLTVDLLDYFSNGMMLEPLGSSRMQRLGWSIGIDTTNRKHRCHPRPRSRVEFPGSNEEFVNAWLKDVGP